MEISVFFAKFVGRNEGIVPESVIHQKIMMYRAKITKIQSWVESNYNTNAYAFVRDQKDVYIEVSTEDEAELLEAINNAEERTELLKRRLIDKFK